MLVSMLPLSSYLLLLFAGMLAETFGTARAGIAPFAGATTCLRYLGCLAGWGAGIYC